MTGAEAQAKRLLLSWSPNWPCRPGAVGENNCPRGSFRLGAVTRVRKAECQA